MMSQLFKAIIQELSKTFKHNHSLRSHQVNQTTIPAFENSKHAAADLGDSSSTSKSKDSTSFVNLLVSYDYWNTAIST